MKPNSAQKSVLSGQVSHSVSNSVTIETEHHFFFQNIRFQGGLKPNFGDISDSSGFRFGFTFFLLRFLRPKFTAKNFSSLNDDSWNSIAFYRIRPKILNLFFLRPENPKTEINMKIRPLTNRITGPVFLPWNSGLRLPWNRIWNQIWNQYK